MGKWMLFPRRADVDDVWLGVLTLLAEGRLGSTVKVSPMGGRDGNDNGLICCYTQDANDVDDVWRVLVREIRGTVVFVVVEVVFNGWCVVPFLVSLRFFL